MKKKIKRQIRSINTNLTVYHELHNELSEDLCEAFRKINQLTLEVQELRNELAVVKGQQTVVTPNVGALGNFIGYSQPVTQTSDDHRDTYSVPGSCGC